MLEFQSSNLLINLFISVIIAEIEICTCFSKIVKACFDTINVENHLRYFASRQNEYNDKIPNDKNKYVRNLSKSRLYLTSN